jgi:hypothetical protein
VRQRAHFYAWLRWGTHANVTHKQKSHPKVAFYLAETEKFGPSPRYSLQTLSSRQISEAIELIGKQ